MKIGILVDELISGGFQKVAIMEAKYFNKLGHEATLVVLHRTKNEGYQDLIQKNDIRVITLSDRLPFFLKINFKFPFFAFFSFFHIFYPLFIWRYLKKEKFDFIVVHGTYTAFSAIAMKKKLGIPFVSFIHDSIVYILENKYKEKFPRFVLKFLIFTAKKIDRMIIDKSDAVVAFPDMIVEIKKIYPGYPKYYPIYNGCEIFSENEINSNKSDYAIAVTKWDQGKNIDFLLDIWRDLEKKLPLKIIGTFYPSTLKNEVKAKIKKRGLEKIVELVGEVTEEKLREYYQNAKFLIHPCREAFGMTILEASASGCPAIFTSNSGVTDLYPDSIKIMLPKENDLAGYKKAVGEFVRKEKEDYKSLIMEYYLSAKDNSWTKHCEKIVEAIS